MSKLHRLFPVVAINVVLVLALLVAAEIGLYVLMSRSAPSGVAVFDKLAKKIYWSRVNLIQYDQDCAAYSSRLNYTLRPGTCTFANDGFSTTVSVNSAGLRDNEASLLAPEIVVLGDSHAMGWGVEADDTFAQRIQIATGRPVLNAGISSYGTARELLLMQSLDLSALRTLVVQYSDNDWWENRTYLEAGRSLPIQSDESYADIARGNALKTYFPGAYLGAAYGIIKDRLSWAETGEQVSSNVATAGMSTADIFLRILAGAELDGAKVHLVILEINTHGRGDGGFIDAVSQSSEMNALRAVFAEISLIKTHDFLNPEDLLFPDGHMNAAGHRKVSSAVLDVIRNR